MLAERGSSVDSLEDGVEATVRLAIGADVEGVTGAFFDRFEEAGVQGRPMTRRRGDGSGTCRWS